jgi:hypothetical protein
MFALSCDELESIVSDMRMTKHAASRMQERFGFPSTDPAVVWAALPPIVRAGVLAGAAVVRVPGLGMDLCCAGGVVATVVHSERRGDARYERSVTREEAIKIRRRGRRAWSK